MYNVNLKNIVPSRDLTCVFAKATLDEFNLWHRRLGHINCKTMNKLVKGNLVRGLPSKVFENDHTCVACKKGKQHRASCKTKPISSVNQPLQRLHMDLFGPTFVKSLNRKSYCLVVTDYYSRFTWVFFLVTKDESSLILKTFIIGIENQLSLKVKIIRSDNGTELKNNDLNQFCGMKGIKREFCVPRTLQQNGIVNRVLVTKPYNKTHSELLHGGTPKFEDFSDNSINKDDDAGTLVPAVGKHFPNSTNTFSVVGPSNADAKLEDITYSDDEDDVGAEADFNNLETSITVSPIPTTRVHKDHSVTQIIGDLSSATQTRSMPRVAKDQEPKRVHQVSKDPSWIEVIQKELLQFKMQKFYVLVDLPHGKRAIGTKWVFRNKKDERGIVVRNKARLVAQGHTQEGGIDYEEVFAPVARKEAKRLFLAYASFVGFMVYKMDVKSAFLYGTIEEEVYVCQPLGFEDTDYRDKIYKVVKALYGLHQAPRAWYETLANYLLENVKRIFRYLKVKPYLGLWYPKDSPFNLVAYSDSDYAGASLDKKSTTGGCQFLRCRIISWKYKKKIVVATSSTEAEYVAAAS
nr:ribonuclease H-like domain-containing protein [Tanacetum cinerariifolium]